MARLFTESEASDGMLVFSEDALAILNHILIKGDNMEMESYILHMILCGAEFEPVVAQAMAELMYNTIENGVEHTRQRVSDEYDAMTGVDRLEQALAEGVL